MRLYIAAVKSRTDNRCLLRAAPGSAYYFAILMWMAATLMLGLRSPASAQTMTLPGKLEVGAGGGASYTIPIAVPPGTAGMAPSLALTYASSGDNGIVGLGWSLSGLPSIGRCPQTMVQEGVRGAVTFTASDRFCLDGQKLIAVSGTYGADGTVYRTESTASARADHDLPAGLSYVGLTASETKVLGSQTLNATTNTFQFANAGGGTTISTPSVTSAPYRAMLSQSVEASFDLNGATVPTTTTTYQYDGYGNATQVVSSTSDGFSKTTSNTYSNDTSLWYLGRLTGASVISPTS
jgi:hypothetical protein